MRDAHRKARLAHLIAADYGSRSAFMAAHDWISKSRLSQALGEKQPFAEDAALIWEQKLDLPTGWFSNTWPTPKEARSGGASFPSAPVEIDLSGNPEYPAIRRVRFKLSAGASGFGVEYLQGDGPPIVFQRSWYESRGFKPENLFAVKVANGSMEPGLFDGDTVVVNTAQTTQRDGVVFAVNYEGEMVVKRLVRDAGQWWLSSDNPDQRRYPRKVCHEDTFILGEVVHKQSERI